MELRVICSEPAAINKMISLFEPRYECNADGITSLNSGAELSDRLLVRKGM